MIRNQGNDIIGIKNMLSYYSCMKRRNGNWLQYIARSVLSKICVKIIQEAQVLRRYFINIEQTFRNFTVESHSFDIYYKNILNILNRMEVTVNYWNILNNQVVIGIKMDFHSCA